MRLVAIAPLLLLLGCGNQQSYQLSTLPSGKQVKVLGVGKIYFSKDDPALMLKYQTDLNLEDKDALRKEVDEIWETFKADVEKAHLTTAIVSANEVPKGTLVKTGKGYRFAFKKMADGTWQSAAFEKDSK